MLWSFRYESATFRRRRPNGISHCKNGEQNPPQPSLPVGLRWPSSNTAVPRPTARTTPNRSSDGWGTVAHVRRKVPIGYNGAPQMCPQKYPFPWTDPQTPLPASFLKLSDLWCQTASGSDLPFFHNALDRQTDRPTDRSRESLTTIGCCVPTATRPKHTNLLLVLLNPVLETFVVLHITNTTCPTTWRRVLLGDH